MATPDYPSVNANIIYQISAEKDAGIIIKADDLAAQFGATTTITIEGQDTTSLTSTEDSVAVTGETGVSITATTGDVTIASSADEVIVTAVNRIALFSSAAGIDVDGTTEIRLIAPTTFIESGQVVTVTDLAASTYETLASDYIITSACSGAATAVTLTLLSGALGRIYIVKDTGGDASTYPITVGATSGNVEGSATYVLQDDLGARMFMFAGTDWWIIGSWSGA